MTCWMLDVDVGCFDDLSSLGRTSAVRMLGDDWPELFVSATLHLTHSESHLTAVRVVIVQSVPSYLPPTHSN